MKFEAIPAESCKQRVSLHEYLALNSCSFTQDIFYSVCLGMQLCKTYLILIVKHLAKYIWYITEMYSIKAWTLL